MKVTLLTSHENCNEMYPDLCYAAARKSRGIPSEISLQDSLPDKNKVLRYCLKHNHMSIFEHAQFTFEITASRACLDQLNRYRHASMCMESSREVNLAERAYVIPPTIKGSKPLEDSYMKAINAVKEAALYLECNGVPKEDTRFLHGMGIITSEVFTCSLREFIWMMKERLCLNAQWEIRDVLYSMVESLKDVSLSLSSLLSKTGPDCHTCNNTKCIRNTKS